MEDLSELLEAPIEPENIPSIRQKVTDKTVRGTMQLFVLLLPLT